LVPSNVGPYKITKAIPSTSTINWKWGKKKKKKKKGKKKGEGKRKRKKSATVDFATKKHQTPPKKKPP